MFNSPIWEEGVQQSLLQSHPLLVSPPSLFQQLLTEQIEK